MSPSSPRLLMPALSSLLLTLLLAACGLTDFLGESDEGPPLPGERISILAVDRGVRPDPELTDVEVRLPKPYRNSDWSQPGGTSTHAMYHLELADGPVLAWKADVGDGSDDHRISKRFGGIEDHCLGGVMDDLDSEVNADHPAAQRNGFSKGVNDRVIPESF